MKPRIYLLLLLLLSLAGLARSGPSGTGVASSAALAQAPAASPTYEPAPRTFVVERGGKPLSLGPIAAGLDQSAEFETSWLSGGYKMTVRTFRRPSESDPAWALRHAQLVDAFTKQFPKDASNSATGGGSAIGTLPNRDQVIVAWTDVEGFDQLFMAVRQPGEPPEEFKARAFASLAALAKEFPAPN